MCFGTVELCVEVQIKLILAGCFEDIQIANIIHIPERRSWILQGLLSHESASRSTVDRLKTLFFLFFFKHIYFYDPMPHASWLFDMFCINMLKLTHSLNESLCCFFNFMKRLYRFTPRKTQNGFLRSVFAFSS